MSYAYVPDWYKKAMSSDEGLVSMNETLKMKLFGTSTTKGINTFHPLHDM